MRSYSSRADAVLRRPCRQFVGVLGDGLADRADGCLGHRRTQFINVGKSNLRRVVARSARTSARLRVHPRLEVCEALVGDRDHARRDAGGVLLEDVEQHEQEAGALVQNAVTKKMSSSSR